jgi:hypothetical protein
MMSLDLNNMYLVTTELGNIFKAQKPQWSGQRLGTPAFLTPSPIYIPRATGLGTTRSGGRCIKGPPRNCPGPHQGAVQPYRTCGDPRATLALLALRRQGPLRAGCARRSRRAPRAVAKEAAAPARDWRSQATPSGVAVTAARSPACPLKVRRGPDRALQSLAGGAPSRGPRCTELGHPAR